MLFFRRRIIVGLLGAILMPSNGFDGTHAGQFSAKRFPVDNLFRNKRSAQRLGRLYRSLYPKVAAPNFGMVFGGADSAAAIGYNAFMKRCLSERIRDDFRTGDTVRIDGWVMSKTELELCARTIV